MKTSSDVRFDDCEIGEKETLNNYWTSQVRRTINDEKCINNLIALVEKKKHRRRKKHYTTYTAKIREEIEAKKKVLN